MRCQKDEWEVIKVFLLLYYYQRKSSCYLIFTVVDSVYDFKLIVMTKQNKINESNQVIMLFILR